jgi:xylose isomerase
VFREFIDERYASYESGVGAEIVAGEADFESLEAYALDNDGIDVESGRQEMLETILNRRLLSR